MIEPIRVRVLWAALWRQVDALQGDLDQRPKLNTYAETLEEQAVALTMLHDMVIEHRPVSMEAFRGMAIEYTAEVNYGPLVS